MIIGIGVVAMLQLLASGTVSNINGAKQTTGINLARNIREMALQYTFDQVRSLDGATLKPAVDSQGNAISDMSDWSQSITVEQVKPDDLTTTTTSGTPVAVHVTVTVSHNAETICDLKLYEFHASP
jgi:hypothetical protein